MGAGFEAIAGPGMHFFWSLQLVFGALQAGTKALRIVVNTEIIFPFRTWWGMPQSIKNVARYAGIL